LITALLISSLLTQTAGEAAPQDAASRNAQAAERAALAAEKAALAAEATATAMQKLVERLAPPPPAAPPPAAPADATPKADWTATVGLGLISLTGNAESLVFNATAAAERKTEQWIFSAKANTSYGQTRPPEGGSPDLVALNAAIQGRGDLRITPLASAYLVGGVETDHIKSIEVRPLAEAGAGIIWLDVKEGDSAKLLLRTDLALRYLFESRYQYLPERLDLPDETLIAPRLGVAFRYALSKDVQFTEDAEVLTNVAGTPRTLVNSTSKVNARITRSLSLGVSFQLTYDSAPAPGKKPLDTALTVGVEMAL